MTSQGRRAAVSLALVLIVTSALWLSIRPGGDGPGRTRQDTSGLDVVQQYDRSDRQRPAPFTAELLDGSTLRSADLVGRPTVVNVWGSWCGPCRAEAPDLARVARTMRARVRFLGLNVRDNPAAARAFERRFGIPYPSVHPDASARVLGAFRGTLVATAVPTTVILDEGGGVAARVVGPVDPTTLRGLLSDVLGEVRPSG